MCGYCQSRLIPSYNGNPWTSPNTSGRSSGPCSRKIPDVTGAGKNQWDLVIIIRGCAPWFLLPSRSRREKPAWKPNAPVHRGRNGRFWRAYSKWNCIQFSITLSLEYMGKLKDYKFENDTIGDSGTSRASKLLGNWAHTMLTDLEFTSTKPIWWGRLSAFFVYGMVLGDFSYFTLTK